MRCTIRSAMTAAMLLALPALLNAEEALVTIRRVTGNQITIIPDALGVGRGNRGRAAGQRGFGRGRRGSVPASPPSIVTVPDDAKITSAMRERRTLEFRVGAELAGGLKHRVFRELKAPLAARIVRVASRITEINVILPETDINQSSVTASGESVAAVRPKRPPVKRARAIGDKK